MIFAKKARILRRPQSKDNKKMRHAKSANGATLNGAAGKKEAIGESPPLRHNDKKTAAFRLTFHAKQTSIPFL